MTKLTKERLEEIAELARKATYKPCAMHMTNLLAACDSEVIEGMARQLLASMEQDPVAWLLSGGGAKNDVRFDSSNAYADPLREVTPLYTAPQLPQLAPEALKRLRSIVADPKTLPRRKEWISGQQYSYVLLESVESMVDDACRAAMLQSEPVSNSDELPLDYLQGHKDGLAWAAQLAEANHPQTGDWLYDDPVALAAAIRKGPDMPEFKSVSVDEDDNFYSWFGRFWYENYQKNNYTTSAKQMLGTMAEFAYRAGRESAALAGNSPVTPGCWCRACRPVTMSDMRFVVCPECGNKRCPHANDHRHYCTGSNEPGQVGSAYPAAPQQEVK